MTVMTIRLVMQSRQIGGKALKLIVWWLTQLTEVKEYHINC